MQFNQQQKSAQTFSFISPRSFLLIHDASHHTSDWSSHGTSQVVISLYRFEDLGSPEDSPGIANTSPSLVTSLLLPPSHESLRLRSASAFTSAWISDLPSDSLLGPDNDRKLHAFVFQYENSDVTRVAVLKHVLLVVRAQALRAIMQPKSGQVFEEYVKWNAWIPTKTYIARFPDTNGNKNYIPATSPHLVTVHGQRLLVFNSVLGNKQRMLKLFDFSARRQTSATRDVAQKLAISVDLEAVVFIGDLYNIHSPTISTSVSCTSHDLTLQEPKPRQEIDTIVYVFDDGKILKLQHGVFTNSNNLTHKYMLTLRWIAHIPRQAGLDRYF
jgi:hypothetical protein